MSVTDIGIDLGTASVLVYVKGKGVVLKEPSVVAFDRDTNDIKAIGEEARLMLGRTPGNIIAVRPLRQGVISDYTVTEKMIKYFVQKAVGIRLFKKPRISICVPSGVTEVEKKAVEEATFAAGAREVHLIEEPVAAAIGAGMIFLINCLGRLLYKKDALGMGDLKLMGVCGILCGTTGVVIALLIGILAAGIWFAAAIALKKVRSEEYMPLGPFLVFGTLFTLCLRPAIDAFLAWYISLI